MTTQITPTTAPAPSRRGFFFGAAAAGVGAAALTGINTAPIADVATNVLPAAPVGGGGYSLSAHVKRYYQTTMV
jgi:hypothetical protein